MSFVFRKHFKRISVNNMKKAGLNGYVYDFSIDYNIIDTSNITTSINIWWKNMIQNNVWVN